MTQKIASAHHRTNLSVCIFATKAYTNNQKKNLLNSNMSSTCLHNMANMGPLTAEIVSGVWDQQISTGFTSCLRYCSDVAHRRPTKLSTMFYRLQGWYIFGGSCPWQNFARYKIHFTSKSCVGLFWQCYCMAVQQRPSAKLRRRTRNGITELSQRAPPIFGRAAITLGIGPYFSFSFNFISFCFIFMLFLICCGRPIE